MNRPMRELLCLGAASIAVAGLGMAVQTIAGPVSAVADTCVQVGNTANVSTCSDLTDVVGEILTPGRPDRGPGNRTPNIYSCLGWDGQWVNADSCT
jgi:hypothetical protein